MPELTENPALSLRRAVEGTCVGAMLRWDTSGQALLVSDAPRRPHFALEPLSDALRPYHSFRHNGLLFMDLAPDAYAALLRSTFIRTGSWHGKWFVEQALLAGIMFRNGDNVDVGPPDIPLLREAMLSCALGLQPVRVFCGKLRGIDAERLRYGLASSSRACAMLLSYWLWTEAKIGVPEASRISFPLFLAE